MMIESLPALVAISAVIGISPLSAQPQSSTTPENVRDTNVLKSATRLWSASIRWENDRFGGTDRFYSDGASIAVSHTGPSWLDPLANWLPWGEGRRTVGYDLTQAIVTPEDITRSIPDPNDRPYAGILAAGLALHIDRSNSYHGLKFSSGFVGPWSLAEQTQYGIHELLHNELPQGWDYQLDNEPFLNFTYEYRHRFRLLGKREGWLLEALPSGTGMLGNLLTKAQAAAFLRFGYHVPDDFGITLAQGMGHMPPPRWQDLPASPSGWGFAIHGGIIANLVLRDMTLDGNSFHDDPSVNKKLFVPAAGAGISFGNRHFLGSFTYLVWGKEFDEQDDNSRFGAVSLAYFF